MLVDDDNELREMMTDHLSLSFIISAFGSGHEAIECINTGKKIDLLITDFNLEDPTGLDGLDIVEALRVGQPDVPVILITGSMTHEPRIQGLLKMPKTNVLLKPVDRSIVDKLIEKLFLETSSSKVP